MQKPRTIQIFLPDGNPRGVKIAEITNRTIQAVLIPRVSLDYALSRPELANVGVYFLVGQSEEDSKPLVYIGETEDCDKRIASHNKTKDFWQYAIVITSQTKSFTKACVRFLEWYCIDQAAKAGRYKLENGNSGKEPHLSESRRADLLDNFEDIRILSSTLGYKLFDVMEKPKQSEILYCEGPDAKASGKYTEDGFIVFAGSTARISHSKSCVSWIINLRQSLIGEGILKEKNGVLELQNDYAFNSPSAAAATILARSSNGWTTWKYKDGKTLDEVKRQG